MNPLPDALPMTKDEETEVKDHLVWSYQHNAWWGPNHCGYTPIILDAGLYTQAEAMEICESANYAPEIKHEEARTLRAALVRFQAKNSVGALLWNALYAAEVRETLSERAEIEWILQQSVSGWTTNEKYLLADVLGRFLAALPPETGS